MDPRPPPTLRLKVILPGGEPFGPGKAALLEAIRETGSIAAAGRRMGMSYQRAWDLVSAMNSHFRQPVVVAAKGGARGGGAEVTGFGLDLLACYRAVEAEAAAATARHLAWLETHLAP